MRLAPSSFPVRAESLIPGFPDVRLTFWSLSPVVVFVLGLPFLAVETTMATFRVALVLIAAVRALADHVSDVRQRSRAGEREQRQALFQAWVSLDSGLQSRLDPKSACAFFSDVYAPSGDVDPITRPAGGGFWFGAAAGTGNYIP